MLISSVFGCRVSYFGRQRLHRLLVETASVISWATATLDKIFFPTWIKYPNLIFHEAAFTVFVQVPAQLGFGLWHGFLATYKCLFHIKTEVSVCWNNTLTLLLVDRLVPRKGDSCWTFLVSSFFFYSSLFLDENQFCVCKVTNSEDRTESSCPHLEKIS